ncbi:hypothetical protein [Vulcanisaeta distributa]|uniref:hypothetical protein n=1 Tax=Vulcanisaeta distributa TaxID=164451 RepID=UPI001FB4B91C|nr:hypothetical protein [Vulcanisaeta distributa]
MVLISVEFLGVGVTFYVADLLPPSAAFGALVAGLVTAVTFMFSSYIRAPRLYTLTISRLVFGNDEVFGRVLRFYLRVARPKLADVPKEANAG